MIFDLSSPGRKNVVRVVFGFLAIIFAVGFVGFGIGGEVGGGGIIDSLTGNNNSTADAFEQQIEDAEEAVEKNPDDPKSVADLVLLRTQSARSQLSVNEETQVPTLTEESRAEFETAVSVWQDYLALEPREVDTGTANAAVSAYIALEDISGAIEAQEQLAESDPSGLTYGFFARLLYADGQIGRGDEAKDQALAESKGEEAKLTEKQLNLDREAAVKEKKRLAELPESEEGSSPELADPFGDLSPTAPGAAGDTGTLPAPE